MLSFKFLNDTSGDEIIGNYTWKVMINDKTLDKGVLRNHDRTTGWKGLISQFAKEYCSNKI